MEVYSVGPDDAYSSQGEDKFVWVVEWYELGLYEGSGEAVALGKDGLLYFARLGHCSCYGPYEDWEGTDFGQGITIEQFRSNLDNVQGYNSYEEVTKKVLELLDARSEPQG